MGALFTGNVKGVYDGVLSGAPLMETPEEKADRERRATLRLQAPPPKLLRLGSAPVINEDDEPDHMEFEDTDQPDGWYATSMKITPYEPAPMHTPRSKAAPIAEVTDEPDHIELPDEEQPEGWFITSLKIEEKFPHLCKKIQGVMGRRNSAAHIDEGEPDHMELPDEDQPAGWNVTSMAIDAEAQAAVKIQALRRGSQERKSVTSNKRPADVALGGGKQQTSRKSVMGSFMSVFSGDKKPMSPTRRLSRKLSKTSAPDSTPTKEEEAAAEAEEAQLDQEDEEARKDAAQAALQRSRTRSAEELEKATADELQGDNLELDRLIEAHRKSLSREQQEEARIASEEAVREAAAEEAGQAARRRSFERQQEEEARQKIEAAKKGAKYGEVAGGDDSSPLHRAVHYGTPTRKKQPPSMIKRESVPVAHDAQEEVHMPSVSDQPEGWNATSLKIDPDYDVKKIKGSRRKSSAQVPADDIIEDVFEPAVSEQPEGWFSTSLKIDEDASRRRAIEDLKSAMSTRFGFIKATSEGLEKAMTVARDAGAPAEELEAAEARLAELRAEEKVSRLPFGRPSLCHCATASLDPAQEQAEQEVIKKMKPRRFLGLDTAGLFVAIDKGIKTGVWVFALEPLTEPSIIWSLSSLVRLPDTRRQAPRASRGGSGPAA